MVNIKNIERERIIIKIKSSNLHFYNLVKSDISRYKNIWNALYNLGFWAVFLYRISHFFHKNHLDILGRFIQLFTHIVIGCDISRKLVAGPNLTIFHPDGIFVGPDVYFGKGIVLGPGCFLGALNKIDDLNDRPVLDDYVNISPGAKLFGNITIGERTVIGPNAVVTRSIPANFTVLPTLNQTIKKYEINSNTSEKKTVATDVTVD